MAHDMPGAPTLAQRLESDIHANRLLDLPVSWADEIIYPHYAGLSIYNVAQSIAGLFGVDVPHPLNEAVWDGMSPAGDVERVVLFITDGLGYGLLNRMMNADDDLGESVAALTDGRGPLPLTSVAPSTTAVALPTLWTAALPGAHGMIGTFMYLREKSRLYDLLRFTPVMGKNGAALAHGFSAEEFVPCRSLAEMLALAGVPVHLLLDYKLTGTGLSRVLHRGVASRHIHAGFSDAWPRLRDVLVETAGQRCYVSAYWPVVDTLSHVYGAENAYILNEVRGQMAALRRVLEDDAVQDGRTLVIIMADHGHADAHDWIDLENDADAAPIRKALRGKFGGDVRFSYWMLRTGTRPGVIDVMSRHYADRLAWVETEAAVEAGLFGAADIHAEVPYRAGDLIVMPRQGVRLWDSARSRKPISIHSGLSESEMMVPFLWKRI